MQQIKSECKLVLDNISWSRTNWLNQVDDTSPSKNKFNAPLMNITSMY